MIRVLILLLLVSSTALFAPEPVSQQADLFMGSDACKDCHTDHYKAWAWTKHAKALGKLSQEDRESGNCIRCHVTDTPEMLAASGQEPKFPNVQCESCHGAGRRHIEAIDAGNEEAARMPATSEETCTRCHSTESPNYKTFIYAAMVGLVHPVQ